MKGVLFQQVNAYVPLEVQQNDASSSAQHAGHPLIHGDGTVSDSEFRLFRRR